MVKTAFSLLELLVVMFVIGVLATIGVNGLIRFRQTVQVEQVAAELVSNLRTVQNMARNSAFDTQYSGYTPIGGATFESITAGFAVNMQVKPYILYYCTKSSLSSRVECVTQTASQLIDSRGESVNIEIQTIGCSAILFGRITGNMQVMDSLTTTPSDSGTCVLNIISSQSTDITKSIQLDFTRNSIEVL